MEHINSELEKKMEETLYYASTCYESDKANPKPVFLHSIRVALQLYELGYHENIILSAILHDLLEDTNVTYDQLKKDFNKEIADLVKAVSFDQEITDKLEQAKVMFEQCIVSGKDALVLKCADILDNMTYITLIEDEELFMIIREKYQLFLMMAKEYIGEEEIYIKAEEKLRRITKC